MRCGSGRTQHRYATFLRRKPWGAWNPAELRPHLDGGDLPEPGLILRTSGELRPSCFLLWQSGCTVLQELHRKRGTGGVGRGATAGRPSAAPIAQPALDVL